MKRETIRFTCLTGSAILSISALGTIFTGHTDLTAMFHWCSLFTCLAGCTS